MESTKCQSNHLRKRKDKGKILGVKSRLFSGPHDPHRQTAPVKANHRDLSAKKTTSYGAQHEERTIELR